MDLTPEDYRRASAAAADALDVPPDERSDFLHRLLDGRAELVRYAVEIVTASEEVGSRFAEPPTSSPGEDDTDSIDSLRVAVARQGISLEGMLGEGAMGVVYRGQQGLMERPVAVKALRASLLARPQAKERFHREIRATAALDHSGIVQIYSDSGLDDPPWFAMELVDGHGLDVELRAHTSDGAGSEEQQPQRRLDLSEAARPYVAAELLLDLCLAVGHAHDRGVIHRDIKPSNVLLTSSGSPKLVDLGVAKLIDDVTLTSPDQVIGSLPYMSPEQARIQGETVDSRTDLYSLGAVLYELLTLRRAIQGTTSHEILTRIRESQPKPIAQLYASVPTDLARICTKAMSKDRAYRYPDAGAMARDLQLFLAGEPLSISLEPWTLRLRRWTESHPKTAASAITLLSVLLFCVPLWRAYQRVAHPSAQVRVNGPSHYVVRSHVIDPNTSMPTGAEHLGTIGDAPWRVPVGMNRIVVVDESTRHRWTYSRWFLPNEDVVLDLKQTSGQPSSLEGMVEIDGGVLSVERPEFSPLSGLSVEIPSFLLDATEVTVDQYRAFLAANPHVESPRAWSLPEASEMRGDHPAAGMTWEDAAAYARWVGKRLPTHAEWMWAARGGSLRDYPWSPATEVRGAVNRRFAPDRAAIGLLGGYLKGTEPARSLPDACTPSGLFHMLGNVGEWTESPMVDPGTQLPMPARRIFCGGYWAFDLSIQTLSDLGHSEAGPDGHSMAIGFRCAASLPMSL